MDDYKQYLAQKILSEDQLVTYRLLSRALGVHVNIAKEMLYDFHKSQNDKRPGTLHATYIIYGVKSRPAQHDGDVEMTDSQMSEDIDAPYSDLVPTYSLSLVSQEQLQESLAQYSEVTSIHVYSLAPHPLKDLQILTDTARQVLELSKENNEPNLSKLYGTIGNPNVRKRERRGGPITTAHSPPPKPASKPPAVQEAKTAASPAVKEESKVVSKPTPTSAPAKKPTSAASLKRQGSSGIGQMFAKAAAKPKKPAIKPSESAATSAVASGAEDNQATGALSDDGEDDAEPIAAVVKREGEDSAARQARKNRQDELRRMMEESDEEADKAADSPDEDPMDEEPPPPEPEPEEKPEEPAEVVASTSGGRRRGRRRVMRKKQITDDKGYLVTIQEPGWESFSEDEAPPPPPSAQPQLKPKQAVKSEPAAKSKKGAAKGAQSAQGNIMSFFSKK